MSISDHKKQTLHAWMKELGISETDLVEKFITGSGSGGQKINKTASCVYLKHEPSGIEIKCQQDRSQELNRYHARVRLCEKYASQKLKLQTKKQHDIEKRKRQKRRRSRRAKQKVLDEKHHRSRLKKQRLSPSKQEE